MLEQDTILNTALSVTQDTKRREQLLYLVVLLLFVIVTSKHIVFRKYSVRRQIDSSVIHVNYYTVSCVNENINYSHSPDIVTMMSPITGEIQDSRQRTELDFKCTKEHPAQDLEGDCLRQVRRGNGARETASNFE